MLACPYSDGLALTGTGFMWVFVSFLVCGNIYKKKKVHGPSGFSLPLGGTKATIYQIKAYHV